MSDRPLTLIRENTTQPERCREHLIIYRLSRCNKEQYTCRLFAPHDEPHKTYINGIGWHAWRAEDA